jgi:hypothetical protein
MGRSSVKETFQLASRSLDSRDQSATPICLRKLFSKGLFGNKASHQAEAARAEHMNALSCLARRGMTARAEHPISRADQGNSGRKSDAAGSACDQRYLSSAARDCACAISNSPVSAA